MKLNSASKRALWIGSAIGLLNVAITNIHVSNRPIGASTSYPYISGFLFDLQNSIYFETIAKAGSWEMWFVLGGFLGSVCIAIWTRRFKIRYVPGLWARYQGKSSIKRLAYSFLGGFILILGARIADGCASGHILSGNMEMAVSSLVFAICVALSYFVFTKYFYKKS